MKSVVICGSRRFKSEIREFTEQLEEFGVIVFAPYLHEGTDEWAELSDDYKKFTALGLTDDHFHKIDISDVVYIYNKDGYSGVSTTLEIGYSVASKKPIYSFSKDEEICRQVLFREIISSPKELAKKLQ